MSLIGRIIWRIITSPPFRERAVRMGRKGLLLKIFSPSEPPFLTTSTGNFNFPISRMKNREQGCGSSEIWMRMDIYRCPWKISRQKPTFRWSVAERVLRRVQQFDPVGVAARDLKECLLTQMEQLPVRDSLAETIVSEYLPLLKNRNHPAIAKRLGVSLERVNHAVSLISKLEPKPGKAFGGEVIQEIVPDVYVL